MRQSQDVCMVLTDSLANSFSLAQDWSRSIKLLKPLLVLLMEINAASLAYLPLYLANLELQYQILKMYITDFFEKNILFCRSYILKLIFHFGVQYK